MAAIPSPEPNSQPASPGPVIDVRNKHVLNVPQNKYTTYDFTPFLTAPAVQQRMLENRNQVPLISPIPSTRIPSPLADNIHPSVIKDVRDFLLGKGKYTSPYCRNYTGNGEEVWKSWKRGWDIWNNHYIDGRVNEVWIARAYKQWEAYIAQQQARGKKPFEGPGGRKQLRRKKPEIGKPYRTEAKALEQLEASIDEVAQGREDWKEWAIKNLAAMLSGNRGLGDGYVEYTEAQCEWMRRNRNRPKWEDFKDYKNKPREYLPLTMDYVYDELHGNELERVKELLGSEFWQKEPRLKDHPGTIEYAIAVAEWEQLPEVRRCRIPHEPRWKNMYEPTEKLEQKYVESAKHRTSPAVLLEFQNRLDINRYMGVGYIEYSWQEAHYLINLRAHEGELDPAIQELEKPDPKDYFDKARPGKPDETTEPVTAIDRDRNDEENPDESEMDPNVLTRPLPIEDDGSSGGFFAMKDFSEYAAPDEDDASFEMYYDPIENSVWRPIQVGEKEVKIDMDEEPEAFLRNSQFEIDGGVDCGRSPYPLLRPLYRYAQSKVGKSKEVPRFGVESPVLKNEGSLLKLKQFWDKVTGTIFNIPTKDIDSQTLDKVEDRDHRDSFENNENYQNPDIFPLDIRRCERISTPLKLVEVATEKVFAEKGFGEVAQEESNFRDEDYIIEPSFKMREKEYRAMRYDDPWWTDQQQKYYRDMPPRNYPPNFDEKQSHLPFDSKPWKDEVEKDSDLKSQYFVTNLDGRQLTINGIDVQRGEIAGPLPEFAIIQTEGGGVSFWHGVGGRFYLQPGDASKRDWSRQWTQLRIALNDEYFGVASGYYWQNAIVGKITEDDEGEGEQDPKWIRWKNAKPARGMSSVDPRAVKLMSGRNAHEYFIPPKVNEDWGPPGPLPFDSPGDELKWVAAQLHFQQIFTNEPWLRVKMVEPASDTVWGGLENFQDAADGPTDAARDKWWATNQQAIQKLQHQSDETLTALCREEYLADLAAAEAASNKRKADHDGYFPPDAKRFRQNIEDKEQEKLQELETKENERVNMGVQELVDEINMGAKEIAEADPKQPSQIDQWKPASDADAEAQAREALQRVRELERLRVMFNETRKEYNESLIPPMKNPIAGMAPSTILTLPDNRWALEAIAKNREALRLDQEVQEQSALNNLNASERLKRKRIAEKRKRGTLGFTPMTDAQRKEQEIQLIIRAKEEKEGNDARAIFNMAQKYAAKKKQLKRDEIFAASVKDGVRPGDTVKAVAAAEKSAQELHEQEMEMAKQLSLLDWSKANGIDEADLIKLIGTKDFDPTDVSTWVNKASQREREKEIRESAETAAAEMGLSVEDWCKDIHGVNDVDEYIKKLREVNVPKYGLTINPKVSKGDYNAALLRNVKLPDGTMEGQFTSWDEVISLMPTTDNWDELLTSGQDVGPEEFGLVKRTQEVSLLPGGGSRWVGEL